MPVQAYPMVWADSHEIPRAPRYSGTKPNALRAQPATRLSRSTARHPNLFTSHTQGRSKNRQILNDFIPQPRLRNPCRVSHANGLANTRYRSPLHTDYLTKGGTKMFHFPPYQHTPTKLQCAPTTHNYGQVTPFGNPRINARSLTPRGYRQPQRPSSAHDAKASTKRSKTKNKPINKKHQPPQKQEAVNEQDSHKKSITKTLTSTLQKTNNQPKKPQKTKRPSRVNEPNKQTQEA